MREKEDAPIKIEANPSRDFGRNCGEHQSRRPRPRGPARVRNRLVPMTTLSARSCRIIWRRVAPSASRMPTSRARVAPRARRRLATLLHAIRCTKSTAPITSSVRVRKFFTISSRDRIGRECSRPCSFRDIEPRYAPQSASSSARACGMETPAFTFADDIEIKIPARMLFLVALKRHPHIGDFREAASLGHNADDRGLFAVNRERLDRPHRSRRRNDSSRHRSR